MESPVGVFRADEYINYGRFFRRTSASCFPYDRQSQRKQKNVQIKQLNQKSSLNIYIYV